MNYAVEPAGKAAGLAAAVVIVAILLHVPRPFSAKLLLAGTFFAVFFGYLIWRLVRRARNPSLYRASGNALTLDDDKSDAKRIVAVGLSTGGRALVHRSLMISIGGPPPNTRLKLAAPVLTEFGGDSEMQCGRIPFVNILARRRSLSAIR